MNSDFTSIGRLLFVLLACSFGILSCEEDRAPCSSFSYDTYLEDRLCVIDNGYIPIADVDYVSQDTALFIGYENGNIKSWPVGKDTISTVIWGNKFHSDTTKELYSFELSRNGDRVLINYEEQESLKNRIVLRSIDKDSVLADVNFDYDSGINRISLGASGDVFSYFSYNHDRLGDSSVRLWTQEDGIYDLGYGRNSDFSNDGKYLYVGPGSFEDGITVINLKDDATFEIKSGDIEELSHDYTASTLRAVGDKSIYARYEDNNNIYQFSVLYEIDKNGILKYTILNIEEKCGFISDVSERGKYIATSWNTIVKEKGPSGTLCFYSSDTGELVTAVQTEKGVDDLVFGPGDSRIFLYERHGLYMTDTPFIVKIGVYKERIDHLHKNKKEITDQVLGPEPTSRNVRRKEFESTNQYLSRLDKLDSLRSERRESIRRKIEKKESLLTKALADSLEKRVRVKISIGQYDADEESLNVHIPYPNGKKKKAVFIPLDSAKSTVTQLRKVDVPKASLKYDVKNNKFVIDDVKLLTQ